MGLELCPFEPLNSVDEALGGGREIVHGLFLRVGADKPVCPTRAKGQSNPLNLSRCHRSGLAVDRACMPRWSLVGHLLTDQEQLAVGQSTTPHPAGVVCWIRRATGAKSHVLFEEAEHVLDGEAPKIHATEILKGHGGGSSPEEINRPLEPGCTVGFQELDAQDQPHQRRQLAEVQVMPGPQVNGLFQKGNCLATIRLAFGLADVKLVAVRARSAFLLARARGWLFVQHPIATQTHQSKNRLQGQKDAQKDHVAV